ncbi:MAG: hypothetical protein WBM48_15475, partial [Polyangiales bacterium]
VPPVPAEPPLPPALCVELQPATPSANAQSSPSAPRVILPVSSLAQDATAARAYATVFTGG